MHNWHIRFYTFSDLAVPGCKMRTIWDFHDYEETDDDRQQQLTKYFKMPRLKKLEEDDSFLDEWLEPNGHAST